MRKITAFLRATSLWVLLLPYAFTLVGAASNQVVLIANHDKFPVMLNASKEAEVVAADGMIDDTHCLMTRQTHLNALADIFDLKDAIYSIGDFILMAGEWLSTFCFFVWLALAVKKITTHASTS